MVVNSIKRLIFIFRKYISKILSVIISSNSKSAASIAMVHDNPDLFISQDVIFHNLKLMPNPVLHINDGNKCELFF